MPVKYNIQKIIEQQNRQLTADVGTYNMSRARYNSGVAYLQNIAQKLTGLTAGNKAQLIPVFEELYHSLYGNSAESDHLLLSDKARILANIERAVLGSADLHQKVWDNTQKLPVIREMLATGQYIRLGRELARTIEQLKAHRLELKTGHWWSIKGRPYKITGNIAQVNYTLTTNEMQQKILFLSDLLPLESSDFEYLGQFPTRKP